MNGKHHSESVCEIEFKGAFQIDLGPRDKETMPKLAEPHTLKSIPESAGVYVFVREYNSANGILRTPRYIGSSTNIRRRIKQHLTTNIKLMHQLKTETRTGSKAVLVFPVKFQRGTKGVSRERLIRELEQDLIREIIRRGEGHYLFNEQGKRLHTRVYRFIGGRNGVFDGDVEVVTSGRQKPAGKSSRTVSTEQDAPVRQPRPVVQKDEGGFFSRLKQWASA